MHDVMAGFVERGDVPGLVTLASRRGEVHVDAIGLKRLGVPRASRPRLCSRRLPRISFAANLSSVPARKSCDNRSD
jgi:hypothetical protein